MAFYAQNFSFNGRNSEDFGLVLSSAGNAESISNGSADVKLITEKLTRRATEYLYGVSVEPMLEFEVEAMTTRVEIAADELSEISKWLFGKQQYLDLVVYQPDMTSVVYKCFLLSPRVIRVGNIIRGVRFLVHCRSAWGQTKERTYNFTFSPPLSSYPFKFTNYSDNTGYTYPVMTITMNAIGGDLSITNTNDASRVFSFSSLSGNETLTIYNHLQIINSSTNLQRLNNFNKKFFRLVSGQNNLLITGNIASMSLIYADAKKIPG